MSDENTGASGTLVAPNAQPQAGTPSAPAANAQQPQAGSADNEGEPGDAVALARELAETRREAAKYRTEAQRLAGAAKKAEEALLPEQERLQRRVTELEAATAAHERERADWMTREAVGRAATRLGFRDPGDAFALLDRAALDLDDKGAPKNVDRLLTDLLNAKPYLGGTSRPQGSADGGTRGPAPAQFDMNAALRAARGNNH